MNWIKSAAIIIWIRAHSDFLFRGLISFAIYLISNSIYSKYEAVLLVTNPEKLFIPLYIYTFINLVLVIWTLLALRWVSGIAAAKKKVVAKESFANKSDEYKDHIWNELKKMKMVDLDQKYENYKIFKLEKTLSVPLVDFEDTLKKLSLLINEKYMGKIYLPGMGTFTRNIFMESLNTIFNNEK